MSIPLIIFLIIFCFIIFLILRFLFSVKLQLQTVNFYSGGLGSGKTLMATKTAINLRNRSKLRYFLLGKNPTLFIAGLFLCIMLILIKISFKFLLVSPIILALIFIVYKKRNVIKSKNQVRDVYSTYPILLGRKNKKNIYSYRFEINHLMAVYRLPERCIVVLDEASKYFPNEAKKSPVELTDSIRWFRHFTDGTLILADQSIGDINIAVRRRVNVVYNFSSFHKHFFNKFYSLEVNRINYMEDVIANINDVNVLKSKRLFDMFGKKRYESRYYKKNYKPIEGCDISWSNLFVE